VSRAFSAPIGSARAQSGRATRSKRNPVSRASLLRLLSIYFRILLIHENFLHFNWLAIRLKVFAYQRFLFCARRTGGFCPLGFGKYLVCFSNQYKKKPIWG